MAQLAALPPGAAGAPREYLHGDYLMLYVAIDANAPVVLMSIRHHRQLSFDVARLWPDGGKFAYATNGHHIIDIDYLTGTEREVEGYATPEERHRSGQHRWMGVAQFQEVPSLVALQAALAHRASPL